MKTKSFFPAIVVLFASQLFVQAAAGALGVRQLRCDYMENPLGIDDPRPCLSWQIESDRRGCRQSAYQLLVSTNRERLRDGQPDLWDSGKVASPDFIQVPYQGQPLSSRTHCFWKVRVWDEQGTMAESDVADWEMGLLQSGDWQAKWIGRTNDPGVMTAPLLRRGFQLSGPVKKARVYVSGLGYFDLYLNGKRVGDHQLDPGYTRYDRRVLYVTFDVTDLLRPGGNAIGAILGNGWYNVSNKAPWDFDSAPWRAAPKLLCQLEVELADGRRVVVASDSQWKTADSPIVYNTIYSGETYDARRERPGWNEAGFADGGWDAALLVEAPGGQVTAQMMPPIRIDRVMEPVRITEPASGIFVFDFGQNLAGRARLRVRGPAGTKVSMKYSELLGKDGRADQSNIAVHVLRANSNQVFQTDTYILKGDGVETWHSRFAYDGFRYVEVSGFPGRPGKDALSAVFFHSDVPEAGEFECSNPLLNRIWSAARWSYLSNLQGIPTDCPHREKNGWTGDAHLAAEQGMLNYFPPAVYRKWLNDLDDEQRPDGRLPGIVPTSGWGYAWGNGPAWDSAFLLIPYYQYVYYDDTRMLQRHFEGMKRYVDYLGTRAQDGIVSIGLNDWAPWKTKTDAAITDTAYYYVDAKVVALAARSMGKTDDARRYTDLAARIRSDFNRRFFHPESGLYDNGSQTALSCALYQGLVEPQDRARVMTNLVAAVAKQDWHIDTGILGAKYLLNALLENGRADAAYRVVNQKDEPGWGWWIEQGATTLWEEWGGGGSHNHIMFGDVSAWFFKALAGLQPDPEAPGFRHFRLEPHVVGDLTAARARYDSIRGRIVSDWKVVDGEFRWSVTVPPGSTATVSLPIANPDQVREGGHPAGEANGLRFVRADRGRVVYKATSGAYDFSGPLAR